MNKILLEITGHFSDLENIGVFTQGLIGVPNLFKKFGLLKSTSSLLTSEGEEIKGEIALP